MAGWTRSGVRTITAAVTAMLLASAATPVRAAGDIRIAITRGRVSLSVTDAPLADVLAEWSRVGDTRFIGAEPLGGERVTLHLVDAPEAEAIRLLLRPAAGYVAARRRNRADGASRYDLVTILAARSAPPAHPAGSAAMGGSPDGSAPPAVPSDASVPPALVAMEELQRLLDDAAPAESPLRRRGPTGRPGAGNLHAGGRRRPGGARRATTPSVKPGTERRGTISAWAIRITMVDEPGLDAAGLRPARGPGSGNDAHRGGHDAVARRSVSHLQVEEPPLGAPRDRPGRRPRRRQRHRLAGSDHPGRRVVPASRVAAGFRAAVPGRRRRPALASPFRGPRPRPPRARPRRGRPSGSASGVAPSQPLRRRRPHRRVRPQRPHVLRLLPRGPHRRLPARLRDPGRQPRRGRRQRAHAPRPVRHPDRPRRAGGHSAVRPPEPAPGQRNAAPPGTVRSHTSRTGTSHPDPRPLPASAADPSSGEPEDGSRFDILVVYTPAARDGAGGTRAVEALIDLFIATANRAFADSGVIPRLHLTQALEVDYVEAGNYGRDLTQLENEHHGDLGEIHEIRNLQAADLVHILVEEHEPTGAYRDCGLAGGNQWALPFEPPYRFHPFEASFALTVRTPWCDPPMVFAHEVGHNLGMVHDRYVQRATFHEMPHHPYAFGYVNQRTFEPGAPASSRWMTLMAVNNQCGHAGFGCTHILRFSNPDRTWLGYPTGVAYRGGGFTTRVDGPADATQVINLTRHVVANIRPAPCLRVGQLPTVGLQASNGQFIGAHYAGGGPVTADREALEPWAGFHFEDENGGCVDAGDVVSLRTHHGFYLRAEGGGGGAVDATATTAGPSERFVIHRIGAQWVRTANIHNDNIAVRPGDLVTLQAASGHFVVAEQGGGAGVRADRRSATAWGRFRVANVEAFVPLPDATAAIQPFSP